MGADESKTVYIIYDYKPSLYYERVKNMWLARLAKDQARLATVQKELAEINYSLYGTNDSDYILS